MSSCFRQYLHSDSGATRPAVAVAMRVERQPGQEGSSCNASSGIINVAGFGMKAVLLAALLFTLGSCLAQESGE